MKHDKLSRTSMNNRWEIASVCELPGGASLFMTNKPALFNSQILQRQGVLAACNRRTFAEAPCSTVIMLEL